jgi:beta-galactosidase
VNADRIPHPGLHAIKYVYRYLHATPVDLRTGRFRVKNWYDFIRASELAEALWEIKAEGRTIASGRLPELDLGPGEEKEYTIPMPAKWTDPGRDYWLNLSFVTKADTPWAKKGHEVAWEQWALSVEAPREKLDLATVPKLEIAEQGNSVRLSGPEFAVSIDKKTGRMGEYVYRGTKLLERGPAPDFWRAPTDNDRGAWKSVMQRAERDPVWNIRLWRGLGANWLPDRVAVERIDDKTARAVASGELAEGAGEVTMTQTIYGSGDVVVEMAFKPGDKKLSMMPRFGTILNVAPGLENLAWYGRGPVETYQDRGFERVGVYRSTVDKEWVEYSKPQENGNKSDVRWVALTTDKGVGLLAAGMPLLSVRASHYTADDVEAADYSFKLTRRPEVYLNLDLAQMGAGGIDSWSPNAYPMQPYRIASDRGWTYRYRLSPVAGDYLTKARVEF